MAKGLRSKVKRAFRTAKRERLEEAPVTQDAERKRLEIMQRIMEQGKAQQAARDAERTEAEAAGPQSMDADGAAAAGAPGTAEVEKMEMDVGTALASRKGRRRGVGKRVKKVRAGISGANQFHPRLPKGHKRRKNKHHAGYTLATSR